MSTTKDPAFTRNLVIIVLGVGLITLISIGTFFFSQKKKETVNTEPSSIKTAASSKVEVNEQPEGLSQKITQAERDKAQEAALKGTSFMPSIEQKIIDIDNKKKEEEKKKRDEQAAALAAAQASAASAAAVKQQQNASVNMKGGVNTEDQRYIAMIAIADHESDRQKSESTKAQTAVLAITEPKKMEGSGTALTSSSSTSPLRPSGGIAEMESWGQMGDKFYVQLESGVVSDVQSPVIVTLISGKGRNSRLSGAFQRNQDGTMSLIFSAGSAPDGRNFTLSAVAIDAKTGVTAIDGSVNNKWMERFVLPMTAAALGKYGELIAKQGATSTISGVGGVGQAQTTQSLDAKQLRTASIGAGLDVAKGILMEDAKAAKPTTTLPQYKMVMVMLLQDLNVEKKKGTN